MVDINLPMAFEKLHRLFGCLLEEELTILGIEDLTSSQARILLNIGNKTIPVGEIEKRELYLGRNVSYLLQKMYKNGWIIREYSKYDGRSCNIKLSLKGLLLLEELKKYFDSSFFNFGANSEFLLNELQILEKTWKNLIRAMKKKEPN